MGVSCQFHTYTIATELYFRDPIDYADNKKHNKEISGKPRLENFIETGSILVNSSRKLKIMMQTKWFLFVRIVEIWLSLAKNVHLLLFIHLHRKRTLSVCLQSLAFTFSILEPYQNSLTATHTPMGFKLWQMLVAFFIVMFKSWDYSFYFCC